MGLLDFLNDDSSQLALGLLAAAGPSATPASFGQRLYGAMQGHQQYLANKEDRAERKEDRKLRTELTQLQMKQLYEAQRERQAAAARQATLEALPAQFMTTQQKPAFMDDRDVGQPGEMRIDPNRPSGLAGLDFNGLMNAYASTPGGMGKALELHQMFQKDNKPIVSKPGDVARDPTTGKVMWRNEQEPEKTPEALRALELIYGKGSPEYVAAAKAYALKMTTHQPPTQVRVDTGQKGLDNTLKLRGDFRSEPTYKAHQEMQSAYSQIKQALSQQSPAGDLAGATKIMKLLDPGSVVRESELGMAMQASGLLDRVENYAKMISTGQKLTPTQRADFQSLADRLYSEAVKQYNSKRSEYVSIAERNGLNVLDVAGPESVMPKVVNFSDLK